VARPDHEARKDGDTDRAGLDDGLVEIFAALGLKVSREEGTGLKVLTLKEKPTAASEGAPKPVGLDDLLEHMNADQLKQVARRYHPKVNATRVAESKKAILTALGKPALLDAMIAELNPFERALLSEVKRQGGTVDGWALVVFAALRGFTPDRRAGRGSVYKRHLGDAPGVAYLGTLLRDGLLIPVSGRASWFSSYGIYYASESSPADDLVYVDRRVLDRLPDEPRPAPKALDLKAAANVTPTAGHPAQSLLELCDVMQLLIEEGGLQITQHGKVGKPLLSRLAKRRPWLEGRLERLLGIAMALGLFSAPKSGSRDPWKVQPDRLRKLQSAPLPIFYAFLIEAFLPTAEESAEEPWSPRRSRLVSLPAARRALLEGLEVLPEHPVRLEEALEALWRRVLNYLVERPMRYWGAQESERPAWFTETLTGTFRELGLVAVAELPGAAKPAAVEPSQGRTRSPPVPEPQSRLRVPVPEPQSRLRVSEGDTAYRYAVMPAPGLAWLQEGRRLQQAVKPPSVPELRALLGLDPDTGKPKEACLLIQPNFDILVYLDRLTPFALTALSGAECTGIDAQTASYTLTRSSLYRALEAGHELDGLLGLLQEHSMGVPDNVARSLRDWASRRERLRVQENVKLLEYASEQERDAALKGLKGARPLAERFVLLGRAAVPKATVRHHYGAPPTRTLRFHPEGRFKLEGAADLAGRAVLAQLATRDTGGTYHLNAEAIRAGALTTAARETLAARAQGGIPPQVEALMTIWEGKSSAPAVAKISVFQHPAAAALAKHPRIAKHLDAQLNDTSYLVQEGHEEGLESVLDSLGVKLIESFEADIKPQEIQGSLMQTGLNTRKMREMIEAAIAEGRALELHYHQERESYNRYGYAKRSRGKLVTEKITPEAVEYSGSTPYLTARAPGKGERRYIRVGYITGIAVL
jgi:hypothetical protein